VSPPAGAWKYYLLLHTHGLTPVAWSLDIFPALQTPILHNFSI
jgi:hypothetical protein